MTKQILALVALTTGFFWIAYLSHNRIVWLICLGLSLALLSGYVLSFIKDKRIVRNGALGGLIALVGYNIIWMLRGLFWKNVATETHLLLGAFSIGMVVFFLLGKMFHKIPDPKNSQNTTN
ncbi:MAG: hypothetical protein CR997_10815 [Acidobacteria bacterium]|nr:MAG: hypothetical protein CR997_10815 [Acidobacteriota bacterium]